MKRHTIETYTDWADEHPEEAAKWEARFQSKVLGEFQCEHEDVDNQGVCQNCLEEIEGWEPSDAQIFAAYGQSMEPRAAA